MGILSDLFSGNFTGVYDDIVKSVQKLPQSVQNFISLLEGDEGKILEGLVNTAVQDVKNAGFTTASFVAAGKDVLSKLIAQNISTFSLQHIIATLNITAVPLVSVPVNTTNAATDTGSTTAVE